MCEFCVESGVVIVVLDILEDGLQFSKFQVCPLQYKPNQYILQMLEKNYTQLSLKTKFQMWDKLKEIVLELLLCY